MAADPQKSSVFYTRAGQLVIIALAVAGLTACDQTPKTIELRSKDTAAFTDTDTSDLYQDLALTSSGDHKLPLMELADSEVCAGVAFRDASGAVHKGTKTCGPFQPCEQSAQTGCLTSSNYRAMDKSKLTGTMIARGKSFLGIDGRYVAKTYPDCRKTNDSGCTSTGTYRPIAKALFQPKNFKKGLPMATGLVGAYPSSAFPLTGAPLGSLSLAEMGVAKAAGIYKDFYFWDNNGQVRTVKGDLRLQALHILSGKTVYGIRGEGTNKAPRNCDKEGDHDCAAGSSWAAFQKTSIAPGDIRTGVNFGGILGIHPSPASPLKGHSNLPDLSFSNNSLFHSSNSTFEFFDRFGRHYTHSGTDQLTSAHIKSGVTILGVKGTYNGYDLSSLSPYDLRSSKPMPDGSGNGKFDISAYCLGRSNCESHYWQDLTPKFSAPVAACGPASTTCAFRTFIHQVDWAFPLTNAPMTWLDAVRHCEDLTLYGKSNWRMPTQKELLQAVINSLVKLEIFDTNHYKQNTAPPKLWTTTAYYPKTTSGAEDRYIYDSSTDGMSKAPADALNNVACIRELEPAEAAEAKKALRNKGS